MQNIKNDEKIKKDTLIIIPAYNESQNIEDVLHGLEEPDISCFADVLVINDGSTDNTSEIVKIHRHELIDHIYNLGYGSALQIGYKFAMRRNYKYVIQMDADGQHAVENVKNIYAALKEPDENGDCPDIVLGSRYMEGSSPFPTPFVKKIAIKLFRGLIKAATGRKICDPTTGLQGLGQKAFLYYSRFNHFDDQYPDANMLIQMMILKFKVKEIPAIMYERAEGKSMHSGIKPLWYMIRLFYEILSVIMRYKVLKLDAEIGKYDTVWEEKKNSDTETFEI